MGSIGVIHLHDNKSRTTNEPHLTGKKSVVAPKGIHVKIDCPLTGPQLKEWKHLCLYIG